MKKLLAILFILVISAKNIVAQSSLSSGMSENKKKVLKELAILVNTDDNTMATKCALSLPSMNVNTLKFLKLELELSINNLLRQPWNPLEPDSKIYSYTEPKMVPDICFLPGTTRFVKASVSFSF
jgi:hypothetical protein